MDNPELNISNLVTLKAAGASDDVLESKCRASGIPDVEIPDILVEVNRRLLAVADVDRELELGIAIVRTDMIFRKATVDGDNKTALAAQRELNRLLGLYRDGEQAGAKGGDMVGAAEALATLNMVAAHLLPLGLAPADYPIQEHARIAADRVCELKSIKEYEDEKMANHTPIKDGK